MVRSAILNSARTDKPNSITLGATSGRQRRQRAPLLQRAFQFFHIDAIFEQLAVFQKDNRNFMLVLLKSIRVLIDIHFFNHQRIPFGKLPQQLLRLVTKMTILPGIDPDAAGFQELNLGDDFNVIGSVVELNIRIAVSKLPPGGQQRQQHNCVYVRRPHSQ